MNAVRTRIHRSFTTRARRVDTLRAMEPTHDDPLPATLGFVFTLGGLITVGWIAMFLLLKARW